MKKSARIFIADHKGFFGQAIVGRLEKRGYSNLILAPRKGLDLMDQRVVEVFLRRTKPEYIYLAAQLTGGIIANINYPANFIYENLVIQTNVIHAAWKYSVKKLLFFGASCIYPKKTPLPIKESYLLWGPFEKTSEAFSVAKLAGISMCQAYTAQHGVEFIPVVPATVYGPGSSFDLNNSHVLDGIVRRFHEAKMRGQKTVTLWGTGRPRREFLYIDDLADACLFLMDHYSNPDLINIGFGEDISIRNLAQLVKKIVGFKGAIVFDRSKPDGVMRKILDSNKIRKLGWKPKVGIKEGITLTYEWYKANVA